MDRGIFNKKSLAQKPEAEQIKSLLASVSRFGHQVHSVHVMPIKIKWPIDLILYYIMTVSVSK